MQKRSKQNEGQAGHSEGEKQSKFVPRIISWNMTFRCNLRCAHCYIDAESEPQRERRELSTEEGKRLIEQISEVSHPILVLSGGEPLLRKDIFILAEYANERGLTVALGTNGTLISEEVARRLRECGVKRVAISIDSISEEKHDAFRGVRGAWRKAVEGINACVNNDVEVQINTTVTHQNYDEIERILNFAVDIGAVAMHLFFLVPTGRGKRIEDISAEMYERMLNDVLEWSRHSEIEFRPVCAPQFMRIAIQKGMNVRKWTKGCIAGMYYCRIYPSGEVTPCPYLPINVGSVRERTFSEIWFGSEVLQALRNPANLKGKCGVCEFRDVCGGCRARAYGLSSFVDVCGGLQEPSSLSGDFLAEEPWCPYIPRKLREQSAMQVSKGGKAEWC